MGAKVSRRDFDWSYTEEPHATRRKMIMKKHPEIKDLFGIDRSFKYVVAAMVFTQIFACYLLKDSDWLLIFLQAYFYGGVVNHALTLAIHELSHNVAYGNSYPLKNRFFGIFANLPIGVPMSVSFKKYHVEHHRYLGEDMLDTDVPTALEAKLFTRTITKLIWLFFQPLFYAFRPMIIYKKCLTDMEVLNAVVQFTFDYIIYHMWGIKPLVFLLFGTLIAMGWHPVAGHFISEHYVFNPGQETTSYYGPLNHITFNVGYHVEHHDFPYIPGDKLPYVRRIAPEFYAELYKHTSWLWVLYKFIADPALGPYARIKRERRVEPDFWGTNMLKDYWLAAWYFFGLDQVSGQLKRLLGSGGSRNESEAGQRETLKEEFVLRSHAESAESAGGEGGCADSSTLDNSSTANSTHTGETSSRVRGNVGVVPDELVNVSGSQHLKTG
jgi:sphingolipid delta-4 desaturase